MARVGFHGRTLRGWGGPSFLTKSEQSHSWGCPTLPAFWAGGWDIQTVVSRTGEQPGAKALFFIGPLRERLKPCPFHMNGQPFDATKAGLTAVPHEPSQMMRPPALSFQK